MKLKLCFSIALLIAASVPVSAQDKGAGEAVFAKCKACHSIGDGATNRVGPQLNGVVGRPAGSAQGYNYSAAMKSSKLTWDEATLATYLHGPKALVPGTKMTFAGLKSDQDIGNLIAYLKQFAADGTLVAQ